MDAGITLKILRHVATHVMSRSQIDSVLNDVSKQPTSSFGRIGNESEGRVALIAQKRSDLAGCMIMVDEAWSLSKRSAADSTAVVLVQQHQPMLVGRHVVKLSQSPDSHSAIPRAASSVSSGRDEQSQTAWTLDRRITDASTKPRQTGVVAEARPASSVTQVGSALMTDAGRLSLVYLDSTGSSDSVVVALAQSESRSSCFVVARRDCAGCHEKILSELPQEA